MNSGAQDAQSNNCATATGKLFRGESAPQFYKPHIQAMTLVARPSVPALFGPPRGNSLLLPSQTSYNFSRCFRCQAHISMAPDGPRKRVKPNPNSEESTATEIPPTRIPLPADTTPTEESPRRPSQGAANNTKDHSNRAVRLAIATSRFR
jgi:hypothetical protein